jgi:hypothetical protein
MSEPSRGYATGVFKRYRVVRNGASSANIRWRIGLIHLVPGVRLKYRGHWYYNGATR